MQSLQEKFQQSFDFLLGIELITTRGSMAESSAVQARAFAGELASSDRIDWISITDNAGGNPMLAAPALGRPILYAGKEVVIHLSCKDFNRNGLESEAWRLASEGFHNILALSGDYPVSDGDGMAKPVFDIDSVGLLRMLDRMNGGYDVESKSERSKRRLQKTSFFPGAVVTNFKLFENEVIPQYLKLEKKIECGAQFVINQIGYDSRKIHELFLYLRDRNLDHVPLVGNVFVLSPRVARLFHSGRIPGVVVSDELLRLCEDQGASPDRGKRFFQELAAKQIAVFRGLGYRGSYLGGVHEFQPIEEILDIEKSFAAEDWKEFAKEIRFSRPGEFFMLAEDPETGLCSPGELSPAYQESRQNRKASPNVDLLYRISKWTHDRVFEPDSTLGKLGAKLCRNAQDDFQGPAPLRLLEKASKSILYACKDCGDCSLPEIAFLCPESQCVKNQRNGPCGGTREGQCEVEDFECIWSRAYDRLKYEGREKDLLTHAPVVQDQGLRGTSSWANTWLGRDHLGQRNAPKD
jgi:methylenetetrahydrofolate reductase (NADPH)